MKIFTKHLLIYAGLMALYTLAFRIGLSYCIGHSAWVLLGAAAIVYGIVIFFTAWLLGKAENMRNSFFDLGFRMHLTTYLVFTAVSLGWFYLGNPHPRERIQDILQVLIIWGVIVVIHIIVFLITRKNTIRGIRKDEIF